MTRDGERYANLNARVTQGKVRCNEALFADYQ